MKKPIALIILDGYGLSDSYGNAIFAADTPNMDNYFKNYPNSELNASGLSVGLPDGQMGNSEVGHTNIGAGRVVYQDLTKVTKSIKDGDFFENEAFLKALNNCAANNSDLHLCGLLSDGGVHSHTEHLYALLELCKRRSFDRVYVHVFLDGRDVSPTSGADYISALEGKMKELNVGKIATVMGRYYVMDRDNRWERVEKAYNAMVLSEGEMIDDAKGYVAASYKNDVTDEFVLPAVICENGAPVASIKANDSVIFYNFRPDRAREITRVLVDENFNGFSRKAGFLPLCYICLTQYDESMPNVSVAYPPKSITNTLGEYISSKGMTQLRIAETEKYAHVTFFFNGGAEDTYKNEIRELVPSPKVATYDLKPEMSAYEVADKTVSHINSENLDLIILNFANCDMVGHTGIFSAAVKAAEAVDECVKKVVDSVLAKNGVAIITADHGNADKMYGKDENDVFTAHSTNNVPFIIVGSDVKKLKNGGLADIAPTILSLMGLEKPSEMTGTSLILE